MTITSVRLRVQYLMLKLMFILCCFVGNQSFLFYCYRFICILSKLSKIPSHIALVVKSYRFDNFARTLITFIFIIIIFSLYCYTDSCSVSLLSPAYYYLNYVFFSCYKLNFFIISLLNDVITNEQRLTRQRDRVLIKRNGYVRSISELAERCLRDPKDVSHLVTVEFLDNLWLSFFVESAAILDHLINLNIASEHNLNFEMSMLITCAKSVTNHHHRLLLNSWPRKRLMLRTKLNVNSRLHCPSFSVQNILLLCLNGDIAK